MKLNSREKKLFVIFIFVGAIFVYYRFILINIKAKTDTKKVEETKIQEKYNSIKSKVKDIDLIEKDVKSLEALAYQNTNAFYDSDEQNNIIINLDDIMKKSDVKGTLKFKEAHIKILNVDDQSKSIKENDNKEDENTTKDNSFKIEDTTLNKNVSKYRELLNEDSKNYNFEDKDLKNKEKDKFTNMVIENEVNIEFNSSYESYYKLVENLEKNDKFIEIKNCKIEYLEDGKVKGNLIINMYSIPKI